MKLLRLATTGFGGLRGYFRFDPEKITVVVDDNERGKSTMLAAVAAALYGLDDDRRSHRVLTPLERWHPWDRADYDVEIEAECDGETYTVTRDFSNGTVVVRNGAGQDVTAEFREGKDGYPVGRRLLGLDAEEFEKCALVRQGDLFHVVPGDEKERRNASLRARLEAAADTRSGDTSATEALRVLEGGLRKYNDPEVDSTIAVATAIDRLELKQLEVETRIKELEHDLSRIAGPLEELATLGDDEVRTRETLAALEAERRTGLATDAQRQLEEHRRHLAEVDTLRQEAESLEARARIPADADSQLREAVVKLEAEQGKLADLEKARHDELGRQRAGLEAERASLAAFESGTPTDADRCVALAAEMRRVAEDDSRLRDEIFSLRESLAAGGHDPERLQWLSHRLGGLKESDHQLLRRQSELALAHQTEVAGLENQRTGSSETLREIDARRNRWNVPGWFLLALGFSVILAGVVVVLLQGIPMLSTIFFVAGALMLGTGVALVTLGRQLRGDEREEALRSLSEAQRRLNQLRQQRAETESELEGLARQMGYRDHIELLKEWSELVRLHEESAPTHRAQQQIGVLEARRQQATDEARGLLARFGSPEVTPENIEVVAVELRRLEALRQKLVALEKDWPWMDEQKRVGEAAAEGFRARALRILTSVGIEYDPARPWEHYFEEIAERMRGRQRHATLVEELIPRAGQHVLPDGQVADLESRLALGGGEESREGSGRSAFEIEGESGRLRERLDEIQKRRSDLRVQVEEISRRYLSEHPERQMQRERIAAASERARRFRDAVEFARDTIESVATETHRRWADYLNQRVAELLSGAGPRIEQIRFGDDLDFSLKLAGGPSLARGKADQQLSCAARDQLYLAVRLAISEFLSRGQAPLPLLLDDVFATSDDERARSGMRMLIESFTGHQIILMTCHRQRYERFAELDPEMYGRCVQWLDTRASGVVG